MPSCVSCMGDADEADRAQQEIAGNVRCRILKDGWDGDWFVRAYDAARRKGWFQRMRRRPDLYRATGILCSCRCRCGETAWQRKRWIP